MLTTTYYTVETRRLPSGRDTDPKWSRDSHMYTRGVNMAGRFDEGKLGELKRLVDLSNNESSYSEYRIIKVTETIEDIYYTPKVTKPLSLF